MKLYTETDQKTMTTKMQKKRYKTFQMPKLAIRSSMNLNVSSSKLAAEANMAAVASWWAVMDSGIITLIGMY